MAVGGCQLRYRDWVILGEITTMKAMLNTCEGELRVLRPVKTRKETLSPFLYSVVQLSRCTCSPLKHAGWAALPWGCAMQEGTDGPNGPDPKREILPSPHQEGK